jgi:hypothetical protein
MSNLTRFMLLALAGLVIAAGLWWWLPSSQSVDVSVSISNETATRDMRDITLVVAGDKTGWAKLKPGETVSANFLPAPDDVPELTLIYRLSPMDGTPTDEAKHSWRGPEVKPGQAYNIRIMLDAQGQIQGRHCVKPCAMD